MHDSDTPHEAGGEAGLAATLRLALVPGVGPRTRRSLLERFGTPQAVLSAAPSELREVQGVGAKLSRAIAQARDVIDAEGEIALCRRQGIEVVADSDPQYPDVLREIPDPPADANTAIPEVSEDAATMRERIAVHLEDPFCASCHQLTDPIGLGFENFDGIGRWRTTENDATIDASGELDGAAFQDAWGLAEAVANHPSTGPCLSQKVLQYATGAVSDELDDDLE
ncbi:MAG: DUF1588 domain-containing protein, partial [Pirellulales bacterium]|nr:DUF1588 domain-containing protein [Pirellulales bacterium]